VCAGAGRSHGSLGGIEARGPARRGRGLPLRGAPREGEALHYTTLVDDSRATGGRGGGGGTAADRQAGERVVVLLETRPGTSVVAENLGAPSPSLAPHRTSNRRPHVKQQQQQQ
jgi:hypothetical protein